jgi:hypothetical protein
VFTILWLILWLVSETPEVSLSPLNDWAVGLAVCLAIDLFAGKRVL